MKNRKILYLLVPLVLLIWGMIIAKIVSQVKNRNRLVIPLSNINIKTVSQTDRDTMVLKLNYRDPFLGRNFQQQGQDNQALAVRTNLVTSASPIKIPLTVYSGLVINPKNKKKTGLLKIDQKDYLVREGETIEGERVLKLYKDSVILVKGKIRRSVKKK